MSYIPVMPKLPKQKAKLVMISVRLSPRQIRRLEFRARQMRGTHGGRYTRSDAVRLLIDLDNQKKESV